MIVPLFLVMLAFSPVSSINVAGKIVDDKGNPIVSASVQEKGTKTAVASSTDGTYKITVANSNGTLFFSAVGYQQKEVKIKGKTTINVTMTAATQNLEEVVVVGYGSQKKDQLEYEEASTDKMYKSVAPNGYSKFLSGRAAGVQFSNPNITKDEEISIDNDGTTDNFNTESYDHITENRFLKVTDNPLSTFSIDVDAASYSNVRRFLNQGNYHLLVQYELKK